MGVWCIHCRCDAGTIANKDGFDPETLAVQLADFAEFWTVHEEWCLVSARSIALLLSQCQLWQMAGRTCLVPVSQWHFPPRNHVLNVENCGSEEQQMWGVRQWRYVGRHSGQTWKVVTVMGGSAARPWFSSDSESLPVALDPISPISSTEVQHGSESVSTVYCTVQ